MQENPKCKSQKFTAADPDKEAEQVAVYNDEGSDGSLPPASTMVADSDDQEEAYATGVGIWGECR